MDLHTHVHDYNFSELFFILNCRHICNTSGSGKTRRIMEGLTKYGGFYLVVVLDVNRVGI